VAYRRIELYQLHRQEHSQDEVLDEGQGTELLADVNDKGNKDELLGSHL